MNSLRNRLLIRYLRLGYMLIGAAMFFRCGDSTGVLLNTRPFLTVAPPIPNTIIGLDCSSCGNRTRTFTLDQFWQTEAIQHERDALPLS